MKRLLLISMVVLLSSSITLAQDFCKSDFDYNGMVDANDVITFLNEFGRTPYHNPCPPDGPSPVPQTGQTTSYATGDDGDLEPGVAWPTPRFTDNGDETVTDNLTGLIWLKNANCFGSRTWNDALSDANGLESGECGLTDVSIAGDWRLPNKRELFSLTHDGYSSPVVPNTAGTSKWSEGDPFTNVQLDVYWSSTTMDFLSQRAWSVSMTIGSVDANDKLSSAFVWPVRGGQNTPPSTTTTSVEWNCSNSNQCGPEYCCCYTTGPEDCQGYTACCVLREVCESLSTCMQ